MVVGELARMGSQNSHSITDQLFWETIAGVAIDDAHLRPN